MKRHRLTDERAAHRRRREAVHALLREIDASILRGNPLEQSLRLACDGLADLFGCALVWISLKEPDGSVDVHTRAGPAAAMLASLVMRWDDGPLGRGPTGTAIRTGQVQTGNVAENADLAPWRELVAAYGLESYITLPLAAGNGTLGALSLYSARRDAFDGEIATDLADAARQVALSLVTARQQEELRLRTVALESAPSAVLITDRNGIIKWVNPAFTKLTGYSADEVVGQTPRLLKSDAHTGDFYRRLWDTIRSGQVWRGDVHNRRKDGSLYVEEMTVTPVRSASGEIQHFIAIKQDVTECRRREAEVRQLATRDNLTGLGNQRALMEGLDWAVARARRGYPSYLLLMDLDRFREVNEALGHAAGDQVLSQAAALLNRSLREVDLLARLGSDQFCAVLQDCSMEQAGIAAERLRRTLENTQMVIGGRSLGVTATIALTPIDGRRPAQVMLAVARAGVNRAKAMGRNRVVVALYEKEMPPAAPDQ